MTHDAVEGWYVDPFRVHAARWFSDGTPTALVRDEGGVESYEAPPSTTFDGDLERLPEAGDASGDDLLRADSVNPSDEIFDPNAATGEF